MAARLPLLAEPPPLIAVGEGRGGATVIGGRLLWPLLTAAVEELMDVRLPLLSDGRCWLFETVGLAVDVLFDVDIMLRRAYIKNVIIGSGQHTIFILKKI